MPSEHETQEEVQLAECCHCGESHPDAEMQSNVHGAAICADCFDSTYTCEDCACVTDNDEHPGGSDLCQECFDSCHSSCDHCGRTVHDDDITEGYCESCFSEHFSECNGCGSRIRIDGSREDDHETTANGDCICRSCYEDNYFFCEGCGLVLHQDDYGHDGHCSECQPFDSEDDDDHGVRHGGEALIRPYSDRTASSLGPFGPNRPVKSPWSDIEQFEPRYGVELEVEKSGRRNIYDAAKEVLTRIGTDFAVCKTDGSLNDGFEIVTAPADLATHRERFARLLSPAPPSNLRSWKTSTCGMHVHVTRKRISHLTIGKLLVWLNDPQNETFVTAVAGRSDNTFCKMQKKDASNAHPRVCFERECDRYQALNVTSWRTIEFRLFRGTLSLRGVLKNLDFVAASVAFCREVGLRDLQPSAFVAFVGKHAKDYPSLTDWLREKRYLPARKPTPAALLNAKSLPSTTNEEV